MVLPAEDDSGEAPHAPHHHCRLQLGSAGPAGLLYEPFRTSFILRARGCARLREDARGGDTAAPRSTTSKGLFLSLSSLFAGRGLFAVAGLIHEPRQLMMSPALRGVLCR